MQLQELKQFQGEPALCLCRVHPAVSPHKPLITAVVALCVLQVRLVTDSGLRDLVQRLHRTMQKHGTLTLPKT